MRVVFMGTPAFAATILERLHPRHEVCAVYCQPDRPSGRGHKLTPSAVKVLAQSLGIPVMQPLNFKNAESIAQLREFAPHVLAVAAYGLILPQEVLDIPVHGPWNVHASLLPLWRGAAPIERAIMQGNTQTGVTIMRMEAGLDTGPMALQRALGIDVHDTAATLLPELAELGASMLLEVFDALPAVTLIPQDTSRATYAAKLTREDGNIDWCLSGQAIHAHVRGVTPRPGARTVLAVGDESVEVIFSPGIPVKNDGSSVPELPVLPELPGTVLPLQKIDGVATLPIVCGDGFYGITQLRPANRGMMSAEAFVNGYASREALIK